MGEDKMRGTDSLGKDMRCALIASDVGLVEIIRGSVGGCVGGAILWECQCGDHGVEGGEVGKGGCLLRQ